MADADHFDKLKQAIIDQDEDAVLAAVDAALADGVQCASQQRSRQPAPPPGRADADVVEGGPPLFDLGYHQANDLLAVPGYLPEGGIVDRLLQPGDAVRRVTGLLKAMPRVLVAVGCDHAIRDEGVMLGPRRAHIETGRRKPGWCPCVPRVLNGGGAEYLETCGLHRLAQPVCRDQRWHVDVRAHGTAQVSRMTCQTTD